MRRAKSLSREVFLLSLGGLMGIYEIIGLVLGFVGALSSFWYIYEKLVPIRRLSWRSAQKASLNITSKMLRDGFSPTLIVGIGRGGAIMGAMVSGCLGHRPLIVIDRKYVWLEGRRIEDMLLRLRFPPELLEKVLLVAGETHTGNTMRLYYNYFSEIGAKEIRRATFYLQEGCTEPIEYVGLKHSKNLLMPWMFSKQYVREDRSEEEAKALLPVKAIEEPNVCFVVRHGESTDNASGDRYSGITDSPLTERGLRQAEDTGRALQTEGIDRIYTSPMKRAVAFARVIQSKTGGMLIIDRRLRELDYGDWEGLTRQEVFERWPELYTAYKQDPIKHRPPNSEDPQEAAERVLSLWSDIQRSMFHEHFHKVVLVTHNSIAKILLCSILGEPLSRYRERRLDNASITKIVIDKSGKAFTEYENKTDHLSEKT